MSGNARLDWDKVRGRLARSQESIEQSVSRSAEERERIYRLRAERLARPALREEESAGERIMLVRLGVLRYGVPLEHVTEVLTDARCAPVPAGPPEVAGLIQVRGEVRLVLNPGKIIGLPDAGDDERRIVLLVRPAGREIGLRVNAVEEILTVHPERRQAPPPESRHALWMTDGLITVLDIKSLVERYTEVS